MKLENLFEGVTLTQINKALKERGVKAELVKGKGYFYFIGDDADMLPETGVYVNALNQLSLEQWIQEWETLAEQI